MSFSKQFAILSAAAASAALFLQASPASAQAYNGGVAEVSVANGNVGIIRGDSGAQVAAAINAPVVAGDYLSTGPGSSAEVQFDGASMLRLASNSQVRFVNLSPGAREAQVGAGTVDLAELQGTNGGAQIDTPSVTVRPNQSGDYRVSVNGNGQTAVTVRSGSATVSSGAGSQTLTPGSTLVAYGPYSNPSISMQGAIGFDSFDQYNISRDQSIASSYNANPYLSPQLAGYSNLANYGSWQNVPGYGWAWSPNNQSQNNFAPYQNGQWVWEPGSGYTWVDNAPYGYAVSHYGTWFNNQNYGGWLWQPPASQYQSSSNALASAWLPAVVSFFLNGSSGADLGTLLNGFSALNGSYGNNNTDIGWIPLAPGEQYQPWYGTNYSYPQTQLTNVPTVTNIYNYYTNARYYRGVTMVPVSAWRSGNFRHYTSTRAQDLRRVYLIRGAVPVVPTTANLHYTTARVARPVTLSRVFTAPRFAAKAPAAHVSFAAQQERIKAIAVAKPKVVPISEQHRVTMHPVYQPVKRAPVHVTAMKPEPHAATPPKAAAPKAASPKHETAPKPETHAAPAVKPVEHAKPEAKPVTHEKTVTHTAPTAKPVTHYQPAAKAPEHPAPQAKPVVHETPAAKPVEHPVPAAKPVEHAAPVVKPTAHPAPAAKPVVHEAPVARPVVHPAPEAKPVPHEAPPAKPVTHPAPEAKPAAHPEAAKTAPKSTEEKPSAHPTARPA